MRTLNLPREGSVVMLVDVQEKLLPTVPDDVSAAVIRHTRILLGGAHALNIPVVVTEQYRKGLGPTVASLRDALPPGTASPIDKLEFSCARVPAVLDALGTLKARQIILCGMETHICVLQSVVGLRGAGYDVWVAQDACMARSGANTAAGLRLCEQAGAWVAPTETILFMLMGRSGTPEFKAVSALIR